MSDYSLAPHLAALVKNAEFRMSQAMKDQLAQYVSNSQPTEAKDGSN